MRNRGTKRWETLEIAGYLPASEAFLSRNWQRVDNDIQRLFRYWIYYIIASKIEILYFRFFYKYMFVFYNYMFDVNIA